MHNHTHQHDATAHDPHRRYLCRHVHTNGNRCGSPALRGHDFCYYHDRTRLPNAPLAGRMGMFKMQPIDDRHAIQIALYDILSRIAAGDVDNKRASILLYGLQIASSNLAHRDKAQAPQTLVEDVSYHHRLGDLAPIQEIIDTEPAEQQRTAEQLTIEQPTTADGVILREAKDPSSSATTDLNSASTPSTPRHSEPQAQNLSIPEATEPQSLTLAAVKASAHNRKHRSPTRTANKRRRTPDLYT